MFIKICGITTLEDARQAVAAGADALGFNFWPRSVRYIDPEKARGILAEIHGVLKVGVVVDEDGSALDGLGLDLVQVHGNARPAGRYWQAFSAGQAGLSEAMAQSGAEAFLIDTPAGAERGGTGKTFDWSLALGLPGKIVLAGGLGADNVAAAIEAARPWGVDACSRLERAPGLKDHDKVAAFVRAARQGKP